MRSALPTPDQLEPIRKMRPLTSFSLMVAGLMIAGIALAIFLTIWKVY